MSYAVSVIRTWRLQEAKARFSQLVDEAMKGQPQLVITGADLSLWQALGLPKPLSNEEAEALFSRLAAE